MTAQDRPTESQDALPTGFPKWSRDSLVEDLPFYVILKDLSGTFIYVNRKVDRLLELPRESIVGKTDFDFFPREIARKYRDDDQRVIESGDTVESLEENRVRNVSRRVKTRKSPLRDSAGQIVGVEVIFWDVTAHLAAEADLEQERYLFQTLLHNLPDFIYFKDLESKFLRVSDAHAQRMGLAAPADAIGTDDSQYFSKEYAQSAREDELHLIRTGQKVLGREEHATWPDGSQTWVSTSKLPLRDKTEQIVGTFGISRDITQLKDTAAALEQARLVAEAASRAKSEFVANLSHEIRTPMNAIIGMAELLQNGGLDAVEKDQAQTIVESAEALLALLNEILDFSRVEAGRVELDPIPIDLRENIGGVMKSLSVRAHEKEVELAHHIDSEIPDVILVDFIRLRQVLVNLIGNALKFTESGEVVLSVVCEKLTNDAVTLQFQVRDTGIGIPREKLKAIFEEFEQVDKSTSRRYGGTGLGLAIATRLVQLMGGQIDVDSEPGKGSTFAFSGVFPVAKVPVDSARTALLSSLAGKRVLVVDDNETSLKILSEMVSSWGMRPTTVSNGHDALEVMRQSLQTSDPFTTVVVDANMPTFDGFALAKSIGQNGLLETTKIIMLTSGVRKDEADLCAQLGIQIRLRKPVRHSELLTSLAAALGIKRVPADGSAKPSVLKSGTRPLRILVAEDNLVNQKLAIGLLSREGHEVTIANNGNQAVKKSANVKFDLILMDLEMPEMDGLEATRLIRSREQSTSMHVPIVAMTARALASDEQQCLDAGMDAYISKPIRQQTVFETISFLTENE